MDSEGKVTFEDWTYLQKCLKYEKLRLSHDEIEKKELLSKLEELHRGYYEHQLKVREFHENANEKKHLIPDAHAFLGDHYHYVEAFVTQIRNNPDIFAYVCSMCRQRKDNIDSLVESFSYSFFLDLVHPENTELELLNAIHRLIKEELTELSSSGHVSNLLNENLLLRKMLILYMKRKNQLKYMKLVFKKPLREIIHDQERIKDLKLDPKLIYKIETERLKSFQREEPSPPKKKSLFGSKKKVKVEQKEASPIVVEVTDEEALQNIQVKELIEGRSQVIIQQCRQLLQALYRNVRTMPYGLRGICKKMIDLIDVLVPGVSEADKFSLLGNMLFTFWWIPAIFDPIKNGLLQNVIIHSTTLHHLKLIGTIFKHIFKESKFDEPQYGTINNFITEESILMKDFFREILTLDDGSVSGKKKTVKSSPRSSFVPNTDGDQTMFNYYKNRLSRPLVSPFNFNSKTKKQIESMNEMKEFRVTTVVLALENIKFLAKIVKENEDEVVARGWTDMLRYAKTIRNADETDALIQYPYVSEIGLHYDENPYLFFIKRNFGENDLENSYVANLHKSITNFPKDSDFEGIKLLTKVMEATRNLLVCLDLSIFFDLSKEWSLKDISEYVIQFSYLFENKKTAAQEGVPLKLLAQFLATYLKCVPEEYKSHNFRKLFTTLLKECEERFQVRRKIANKNKKLLLLAINFMEKHVNDMRQDVRVQESLKRKKYFLSFIRKGIIPACLLTIRDGSNYSTQVFHQSVCPHSKLSAVGDFVLGNNRKLKTQANEETHVQSIEEFYQKFMKLDQVVQSTEKEDDPYNVGGAFFDYINLVKNVLIEEGNSEEVAEITVDEIEKHITSNMYNHIFPSKASIEDTHLYNRTLELDWVKPSHMDIEPANRNEDMWKFAIEALEAIDTYRAPSDKLNCLAGCMSIIVNVLGLMSSGSGGVGTDDSLPIIIYVVLKAKPQRLYSNLNYISKFRHHTKMIGLKGFVFQQFQSAATFIESLDFRSLSITEDEYNKNVEECKAKFGLSR